MSEKSEVARLTQRVKEVQSELAIDRERRKPTPNQNMRDDTVSKHWEDYWCDFCQLDQSALGTKSQHVIFGEPIIKYRAVCPHCGLDMMRLVSHRDQDT